jgi:hypothetical protein
MFSLRYSHLAASHISNAVKVLEKTLPILYRRNKSKKPNILKVFKYMVGCAGIEQSTY